jgi:ARG/rhodanese/phosphatase superfamily protein
MERSIFAAIIGGFLGIITLGGLALIRPEPAFESNAQPAPMPALQPIPQPKPEADWRLLDPVTYENISVFPVVASYGQDTTAFLTLEEGLATGEVVVSERSYEEMVRGRDGRPIYIPQTTGASVNQLVLLNRSKRPLLLLAGELVSGGKQDRVIGKDRIVPVGAPPLPLDVFCVEHGRWTGSSQFAAALTIVHPSVRERAAVDQVQTEVWDAVRSGTTSKLAAPEAPAPQISESRLQAAIAGNAHTEAYEKIYQSSAVGVSIDGFVAEVQRRFANATSGLKGERVVGVVIAYGGEVAWSDIFASGDLFDHYWHKLLRSYAVEALARPTVRAVASRESASEFLRRLNGRETQETEPGVYRWSEITEGRLAEIELEALQPKQMKLHRLLLHRTS